MLISIILACSLAIHAITFECSTILQSELSKFSPESDGYLYLEEPRVKTMQSETQTADTLQITNHHRLRCTEETKDYTHCRRHRPSQDTTYTRLRKQRAYSQALTQQ